MGVIVLDPPLILFAVDQAGTLTLIEEKGSERLDILSNARVGDSAFDIETELHGISDLIRRALTGESAILTTQTTGHTYEVWSTPLRRPSGIVTGMVGVVIDTSKHHNLEREFQHQERLAILGQFAGGIAHDFNNFLATIMLYTRLILNSDQIPANLRAAAETIMLESHRASDLIDQILQFSRRSATKTQPVNLAWLIRNITRMLETTLPGNVQLVTEFEGEAIVADADPTGIQQLIMNLAINARDAMPEGGILRIGLALLQIEPGEEKPVVEMPYGRWIDLTVADTGIGMTQEVLDHLYEPFFTTKGARGTGLGLVQVLRIVEQHHGYIQVASAPGKGTTFHVYLPSFGANLHSRHILGASPPHANC